MCKDQGYGGESKERVGREAGMEKEEGDIVGQREKGKEEELNIYMELMMSNK